MGKPCQGGGSGEPQASQPAGAPGVLPAPTGGSLHGVGVDLGRVPSHLGQDAPGVFMCGQTPFSSAPGHSFHLPASALAISPNQMLLLTLSSRLRAWDKFQVIVLCLGGSRRAGPRSSQEVRLTGTLETGRRKSLWDSLSKAVEGNGSSSRSGCWPTCGLGGEVRQAGRALRGSLRSRKSPIGPGGLRGSLSRECRGSSGSGGRGGVGALRLRQAYG